MSPLDHGCRINRDAEFLEKLRYVCNTIVKYSKTVSVLLPSLASCNTVYNSSLLELSFSTFQSSPTHNICEVKMLTLRLHTITYHVLNH